MPSRLALGACDGWAHVAADLILSPQDLLVESIYDLSKPLPPLSDEEMMAAKFTLVRNTWSQERMPEIQVRFSRMHAACRPWTTAGSSGLSLSIR